MLWRFLRREFTGRAENPVTAATAAVNDAVSQSSGLEFTQPDLPAPAGFNRVKACRYGTLLYNINDRYIGRALHEYAEFSQGEVDLFAKLLQPGQTVVDAGANIGAHTVYFCRAVGPEGRVHAFEPQRVIFQALCANLALNSLQNGHAHHAALGERAGRITVDVPDYAQENNFGGMPLGAWQQGEEVALITIDSLDLAACHFMKIDVEGMEQAVIRGAQRTIERHRPLLYVENDRPEHATALVRQLEALDYALHWHLPAYFNPDNHARNAVNVFGNIASRNMLCLPAERKLGSFGLERVVAASLPVSPGNVDDAENNAANNAANSAANNAGDQPVPHS